MQKDNLFDDNLFPDDTLRLPTPPRVTTPPLCRETAAPSLIAIRGAEGMSVGNLHFAGEHPSLDRQGYMNSGGQSGRLVAEALLG
jgi:hypothetical protein